MVRHNGAVVRLLEGSGTTPTDLFRDFFCYCEEQGLDLERLQFTPLPVVDRFEDYTRALEVGDRAPFGRGGGDAS